MNRAWVEKERKETRERENKWEREKERDESMSYSKLEQPCKLLIWTNQCSGLHNTNMCLLFPLSRNLYQAFRKDPASIFPLAFGESWMVFYINGCRQSPWWRRWRLPLEKKSTPHSLIFWLTLAQSLEGPIWKANCLRGISPCHSPSQNAS